MEKQDIDIKLEVHANQEKTPKQTGGTFPDKAAWVIFIPPLVLILLALLTFLCFFLNFSIFKVIFFVIAAVSIYIYARYAFEIHKIDKTSFENKTWYLYNQYWFNGLGAFVGWLALYIVLFDRLGIDQNSYLNWSRFIENISWPDFVLVLVAFFGITGHFPYASLFGRVFGK